MEKECRLTKRIAGQLGVHKHLPSDRCTDLNERSARAPCVKALRKQKAGWRKVSQEKGQLGQEGRRVRSQEDLQPKVGILP